MNFNTLGLIIQDKTKVSTYYDFKSNEFRAIVQGVNCYYNFCEEKWIKHNCQDDSFLNNAIDVQ